MKICKYQLELYGGNIFELPEYTKFLSAGLDLADTLCVWALTDPDDKLANKTSFIVEVVCTGREPEFCHKFLGTVTKRLIVYHIFIE